MGAYLNKGL